MIKSLPIYVGVWTHRHGTDFAVYPTYEAAENGRQKVARDFWCELETDEPMPDLPADRYFDLAEDECFDIELHELQYAPDFPILAGELVLGGDL